MAVPTWLWLVTIGGLTAVILLDLLVVGRRPHAVSIGEATRWVLVYVALAVAFGIGIWVFAGGTYAGEFFAGYITEYSLSVDNLFVFVIIMAAFKVPAAYQHRVLLIGIVIALVMRGAFIAVGAAAINAFSWVFYLFAAVLIVTVDQPRPPGRRARRRRVQGERGAAHAAPPAARHRRLPRLPVDRPHRTASAWSPRC